MSTGFETLLYYPPNWIYIAGAFIPDTSNRDFPRRLLNNWTGPFWRWIRRTVEGLNFGRLHAPKLRASLLIDDIWADCHLQTSQKNFSNIYGRFAVYVVKWRKIGVIKCYLQHTSQLIWLKKSVNQELRPILFGLYRWKTYMIYFWVCFVVPQTG